jgi:hypothetical protein
VVADDERCFDCGIDLAPTVAAECLGALVVASACCGTVALIFSVEE